MYLSLDSIHSMYSGDEYDEDSELNNLAQPLYGSLSQSHSSESDVKIDIVQDVSVGPNQPNQPNQHQPNQFIEERRNLLFDVHFCTDNECTIVDTNGTKTYYCNICNMTIQSMELFITHRYSRHLNELHRCYHCCMRFRTLFSLMIHFNEIHKHAEIYPYICHKCGIAFGDFVMFEDHLTTRRCCYQREIRRVHCYSRGLGRR